MSVLQPETNVMLGILLRELEQTVQPDLTSAHAKTVTHLIGQTIRNLMTREQGLPQLIEQWSQTEAELLTQAGRTLPFAMQDDALGYNAALTDQVETEVVTRMGDHGMLDDTCRRAIQAESDFVAAHGQAMAAAVLPQRSAERRALLEVTPERLTEYFKRKLPHWTHPKVSAVTPILSGFSKQTLLIDAEFDGKPTPLVLRRDLPGGSVDGTVLDEYPVVAALHRHGLPVPEPVLAEPDASEFGEPFTITRRAPGTVVSNPVEGRTDDPAARGGALELAAFLARLHSVKLTELGLPDNFYTPTLNTRDCFIKQIEGCESYYRRHRLQASPTFGAGLAWLRAHVPDVDEAPRMVHGDAGLNNMLMHEGKISVMVDWELVHAGDPGEDVAYTRDWIDRIMPFAEFLAHYYQCGGPRYHPEREKFYTMLADVRVGLYTVRIRDMLRQSEHPEIALMFGAQNYYGYFIQKIAANLLAN